MLLACEITTNKAANHLRWFNRETKMGSLSIVRSHLLGLKYERPCAFGGVFILISCCAKLLLRDHIHCVTKNKFENGAKQTL